MKKRWAFISGVVLIIAIAWFITADLFRVPNDVSTSRHEFTALKANYFAEQEKWDRQKEELTAILESEQTVAPSLNQLPLELLLSYLSDHMELQTGHYRNVAIYPIGKERLLLSKCEKGPLLMTIVVSLEVEMIDGEPQFITLRRGSRELSPELAWVYFGEELQFLKVFSNFDTVRSSTDSN